MEDLQAQLNAAQMELEPQFKALRAAISALNAAGRLAGDENADALPMQKALVKLESAAAEVQNPSLQAATAAFSAATHTALDNLAYEFAADLRTEFATRGEDVIGRPPVLGVGLLTLKIDMSTRKGQWFYGKEQLTRPIPLSLKGIVQAFDQQAKRIRDREIDGEALLQELRKAWQDCLDKRDRNPAGKRINIIETYAQLTMNRQTARFWNAPARKTFKDYERALFARDLVLLQEKELTSLDVDGKRYRLRLGVATKSQADSPSRSIWLPADALDGEYYGDITFE